jgi:hypothetical protein
MAWSDSTMNGCGLVPRVVDDPAEHLACGLFLKGHGPCDVMTCGGVPLLS